jgi:hypothetical protein
MIGVLSICLLPECHLKNADSCFHQITHVQDNFFPLWRYAPTRAMTSLFLSFYITHNDASQSVGRLWTNDQLVAETST